MEILSLQKVKCFVNGQVFLKKLKAGFNFISDQM